MWILKTQDLKKYYHTPSGIVRALDGVSLSVEEGTFGAIVGSSGSGKTTLLHMLGGLDAPTDGAVWVRKTALQKLSEEEKTLFRRRNIGFIFQNYNLVSTLSVQENITLPLLLDGVSIDKEFLGEIVRILKLTEKLKDMPHMLSGGQQQRVAIARALSTKPAVILGDEPTGNLDSITGMEVIGLLKRSAEQFHQTILLVTHNEEIAQMTDRIIRIEDGKIVENNNQEVIRLISRREKAGNKWENRILTGTVAFAVWMLCCVFSLAAGRIRAEELLLIRNAGTKAVTTMENPSWEQYQVIQTLPYIESAGMEADFASADAFLCTVMDQTAWEELQKPAYTDVCGTYPQEADELMLPVRALKSMGIEHPKTGMQIPVEMTDGEGKTICGTFRLCGYYTEYVDPMAGKPYGYFSEAYLKELSPKMLSRTLLMEQRADMDWETVERRLYEDVPMSDGSQQFFCGNSIRLNVITKVAGGYGTAFGMASVICFAAWLLLCNVLQISFGKSVRRFGLLKTLGTTDRQIRKIIWRQTVRSALAGCLTGSGAGVIVTVTCVPAFLSRRYLHGFGNASAMIAFCPEIFALSICIGFCIALLGTSRVIRKLGTLSPVESAHYMEHFSVRMQTGGHEASTASYGVEKSDSFSEAVYHDCSLTDTGYLCGADSGGSSKWDRPDK